MSTLIGGPADGVELGELVGRKVYVPMLVGPDWPELSYAIYRRGHYTGRWLFVGVRGWSHN